MRRPSQSQPATADLLRLADLLQGHVRQLEMLATWPDVVQRLPHHRNAVAAGDPPGIATMLRDIQAKRFAGSSTDIGFFVVCQMAELHVNALFQTDAALNEINRRMAAIRQREGADWDAEDADAPGDYEALVDQWNRRFEELEAVREARFIGWLRRLGELDMADLYANDRAAFDRRREAGRCRVHGPSPGGNETAESGDTGLTQVVTGDP
jgi:hypothetical protein